MPAKRKTQQPKNEKFRRKCGTKRPKDETPEESEESLASMMIQAETDLACGVPVEDWLRDMMP